MPNDDQPKDIHRLVYASRATPLTLLREDETFHDILSASFRRNVAFDITGVLLACDGWFLQALEGPRTRVMQTLNRIRGDRRHDSIRMLESARVGVRQFGAWSMCGRRLSPTDNEIVAALGGLRGLNFHALSPASALRLLTVVQAMQTAHPAQDVVLL